MLMSEVRRWQGGAGAAGLEPVRGGAQLMAWLKEAERSKRAVVLLVGSAGNYVFDMLKKLKVRFVTTSRRSLCERLPIHGGSAIRMPKTRT